MGRDKAFIDWEGQPLIARVIERIQSLCSEVIIVANDPPAYTRFGVPVVTDIFPGKGSLGGVFSGLSAAHADYVLAVACDMPFLNAELLRYQFSLAPGFDVVIPRAQDPSGKAPRNRRDRLLLAKDVNLHPLHAIYSQSCREPIRQRLEAGDLRIISFLDSVYVRVIEPEEVDLYDPRHLSFFNMNTPGDWTVARDLKQGHV